MNQKQCKALKKWCFMIWEGSSEKDREGFESLDAFISKVKKDAKRLPHFMKYIKEQMKAEA